MKLFLISTIFGCFFIIAKGQHSPGYKLFSEFNGDTLSYLSYNFTTNKANFIGKDLNYFFNLVELKPKLIMPDFDLVQGVDVYFFDNFDSVCSKHENRSRLYDVRINFVESIPILGDSMQIKIYSNDWGEVHKSLFGGKVVKNIIVKPKKTCCNPSNLDYNPVECKKAKCQEPKNRF